MRASLRCVRYVQRVQVNSEFIH